MVKIREEIEFELSEERVAYFPTDRQLDSLVELFLSWALEEIQGLRIPEWDKLDKESQKRLKAMTGYGAYMEVKITLNRKLDGVIKGIEEKQ